MAHDDHTHCITVHTDLPAMYYVTTDRTVIRLDMAPDANYISGLNDRERALMQALTQMAVLKYRRAIAAEEQWAEIIPTDPAEGSTDA